MMFRRQGMGSSHRQIAIVRDVVEIVAIVAAGIWAIYVFIYTDRVEPFQKPVAPVHDASMTVEGEKGDLLAVRISQSLKNLGPAKLRILGRTANVSGDSVRTPDDRSLRLSSSNIRFEEVRKRFKFSRFETAFSYIDRRPLDLEVGETFSYSSIIYLPRSRYDALVFDSSFAYTRSARPIRITVVRNERRVPQLVGNGADISGTEIQTSLWH